MAAYSAYTDQELMALLKRGDRHAFGLVFKSHYASLCYYANRFVFNKQEAEDIVDEVFEKFWTAPPEVENIVHLRSYLYMATRRVCIDHLRKNEHAKERQMKFTEQQDDSQAAHIHEMIRTEVLREIYLEIQSLPEQCSKIVSMSYLDGLKNEEIAAQLGLSVQTVKNQKSKGLSILKGKLSAQQILVFMAFSSHIFDRLT